MQGPSQPKTATLKIAATFAATFLAGAGIAFALAHTVGAALGSSHVAFRWRVGLAAAGLFVLAALDLSAIARASYCPLGWRRQTPRILVRSCRLSVVAAVWGFDTGLVVTTIRVAAVSWGALFLAALGLSPVWAGACYGLAFALPFLVLLSRPSLGRAARGSAPADPGLEAMLRKRPLIQGLSAGVLISGGVILLGRLLT